MNVMIDNVSYDWDLSGVTTITGVSLSDCVINTSSVYNYTDNYIRKDEIKEYLKNNPSILEEINLEIRNDKINKLL